MFSLLWSCRLFSKMTAPVYIPVCEGSIFSIFSPTVVIICLFLLSSYPLVILVGLKCGILCYGFDLHFPEGLMMLNTFSYAYWPLLNWVIWFFIIKLREFLMYSRCYHCQINIFSHCVCCFFTVDNIFWNPEVINFYEIQFVFFLLLLVL